MNRENRYSAVWIEKWVNAIISFIFYNRLLIVLAATIALFFVSKRVWFYSDDSEKYKNISIVFSLGSVIIGIFYAILNYEHNQIKYKNDKAQSKISLAYTAASEWHRTSMVENLKITKKLYNKCKHLIDDNKAVEFSNELEGDEAARSALISILNYMELIAIAVKYDLFDNQYIRDTFKTTFQQYFLDYGFYIAHRRAKDNSPTIWINYTMLVERWITESNS